MRKKTCWLLAILVLSCAEEQEDKQKNPPPITQKAKGQPQLATPGDKEEEQRKEQEPPEVDGNRFDAQDGTKTALWLRAIYKKCTKGMESYNYYKRKKAVEFQEKAMQAAVGKRVRWQFQVITVGKNYMRLQLVRGAFSVSFSCTASPTKRSEALARSGVCYYETEREALLETIEVQDKLYITGTVHSYFFNKATHRHAGFSLVNCHIEK